MVYPFGRPEIVACFVSAALRQLAANPALLGTGAVTPKALQDYVRPYVPAGWRVWATARRVWIIAPSGTRLSVAVPAALRRMLRGRNRWRSVGGLRVIA